MIDDREIWACANLLLRQHGAKAGGIAAARAAVLGSEGVPAGQRIFSLIAHHIRSLAAVPSASRRH
jgi:hypothetical protein